MGTDLHAILAAAVARGASDIHLKAGVRPSVRVNGVLGPIEDLPLLDGTAMASLVNALLTDVRRERLQEELQVDLAYTDPALGRFRVNIFHQRGGPAVALRHVPMEVRGIRELRLPAVVERMADERRGLILVTGTTGSGKSTTLAAMIQHINHSRRAHVITIEDPIEYVYEDHLAVISQREIGVDCTSFAAGLRGALRQDPDVILVGEMRDLETVETAILAAETGHLVLSTLHTLDAPETITRAISMFPVHQRDQVRLILANILRGVISQRLLPRADGQGLVPAVEVMVSSALVRECIAEKERTREIHDAIARGYRSYGMQTFDQSLMALWRDGLISFEEALAHATNRDDFALRARGVSSTSEGRWEDFDRAGEEPAEEPIKVDRF